MVRFRRALERWIEVGKKPDEMMQLSLALSSACSEEVGEIDDQIDDLKARIKILLRGTERQANDIES